MQREIKFRGQRQSDSEWIYGDLLQPTELCNVYEISDCESIDGSRYDVIEDTIGQYTGLKDKNGKEIYEGDIVEYDDVLWTIEYSKEDGAFILSSYDILENFINTDSKWIKVIGNIYENPNLLQEEN